MLAVCSQSVLQWEHINCIIIIIIRSKCSRVASCDLRVTSYELKVDFNYYHTKLACAANGCGSNRTLEYAEKFSFFDSFSSFSSSSSSFPLWTIKTAIWWTNLSSNLFDLGRKSATAAHNPLICIHWWNKQLQHLPLSQLYLLDQEWPGSALWAPDLPELGNTMSELIALVSDWFMSHYVSAASFSCAMLCCVSIERPSAILASRSIFLLPIF